MVDEPITRVQEADRADRFRALAAEHLDESYRLARAILGNPAEAEDATHDAFVQAWRKWSSLRDPALFERWFGRILKGGIQMQSRARIAALSLVIALAGCSTSAPASPTPTPRAETPTPTPAISPQPTSAAPTATVSTSPGPCWPATSPPCAHIDVGGVTRYYIVTTPPDVADRNALPLLLVLHGAEMTSYEVEALTGFDAIAMDPGAVVVYAQGEKDPENPRRPGYIWNSGQTDTGFDDVAFLAALIDQMEADYPIDPDRVFILGGSNGGQMAYRAACELSGRIAAIADVIGALLVDCQPSQPVSVIAIHGTADTMTPIAGGGQGCRPMSCPPLADTIKRWRQIDGCTGNPTTTTEGRVETTTYSACADGSAVTLLTVDGGTHDWYSSNPDDRAVTWDFFMSHPRSTSS